MKPIDFERFAQRLRASTLDSSENERREQRIGVTEALRGEQNVRTYRTQPVAHCGCGEPYNNPLLEWCPFCDGGNERTETCGMTSSSIAS